MARSFADPDHLPNRRGGDPPPPEGLPRQRRGVAPQGRGRFPDYDVMANAGHWDAVTRRLMQSRVDDVPPVRFFDQKQERALRAFLDVVLAQDAEPRIPVLEMVDAKLFEGRLDGYRYEDMPPDPETWRVVAAQLDAAAGGDFAAAAPERQTEIVGAFAQGQLDWEISVSRAWSVVMRGALSAFYSHPWAFNEIGFGGPAYPRGYMRRNMGPSGREPYEPEEVFGPDPVGDLAQRGEG